MKKRVWWFHGLEDETVSELSCVWQKEKGESNKVADDADGMGKVVK